MQKSKWYIKIQKVSFRTVCFWSLCWHGWKSVPKRTKPQETTILIFTLPFCILIFYFLLNRLFYLRCSIKYLWVVKNISLSSIIFFAFLIKKYFKFNYNISVFFSKIDHPGRAARAWRVRGRFPWEQCLEMSCPQYCDLPKMYIAQPQSNTRNPNSNLGYLLEIGILERPRSC